jgi:hypothetical protein
MRKDNFLNVCYTSCNWKEGFFANNRAGMSGVWRLSLWLFRKRDSIVERRSLPSLRGMQEGDILAFCGLVETIAMVSSPALLLLITPMGNPCATSSLS